MRDVFARANRRLCEQIAADHFSAAVATLRRIGQAALAEQADWLVIHRERPIELPRLEL
jgi:hypothetical protein